MIHALLSPTAKDPSRRSMRAAVALSAFGLIVPAPVTSQSVCAPDRVQSSGSIYRICMPPENQYLGVLFVWAHGFQDAGEPVAIPEDQLCLGDFCIPELVNGVGFGFAAASYSKTGLAVVQGMSDTLDLVDVFAAEVGVPDRIYIAGVSEGGLITTLLVEQHPEVFSAGIAVCGPIGDFEYQIGYLGDARATFQYFFPGLIPGDPFAPDPRLVDSWGEYYETIVRPVVLDPINRSRLDQWVRVARLPHDPSDYLNTVEESMRDVLRYSVVNLNDAATTLGGFPFDNSDHFYRGSQFDFWLNLLVPRRTADPAAIAAMELFYDTSGVLAQPLITVHTTRDQQVPYRHELFYLDKTSISGATEKLHRNLQIDRFGHCNISTEEALTAFALMLSMDDDPRSAERFEAIRDQLRSNRNDGP